ncbi:hypothetical protein ACJJTC_017443 [Scirpophaga incertulas]
MKCRILFASFLQVIMLNEVISNPALYANYLPHAVKTPLETTVVPSNVLTGTVSQVIAPGPIDDWQSLAQPVPLITSIEPHLEIGEISVDGDSMTVTGTVKITGSFPLFGTIGVNGKLPTRGSAVIDTGNVCLKNLNQS